MKSKPILTVAALLWVGSLAFAYLAGRGSGGHSSAGAGAAEAGDNAGSRLSALELGRGDEGAEEGTGEIGESAERRGGAPFKQLQEAMAMRNPVERMNAFMAAISNMGVEDFEPALESLGDDIKNGENRREIGLLLYAWAEKDGSAAVGYLDEASLGREGYSLYYSALSAWASGDVTAAEAWAKQKHEGKDNNENYYMLGVIDGVAKSDVAYAGRLAQDLGYGRARGDALGKVVDELFRDGEEAAMRWVESIGGGDERFRAGAAGRVAAEIARNDPQGASEWVMGLGIAEKDRAVASVAYEWGRKSPEEAADWVSGIEDLDLRSRGMETVVETWTQRDADAAGTWLGQMPASPALDRPVRSYALMVRERDPEAAIAWANTITDEKLRGETVERIGSDWLRKSPDEARAFLQTQESVPEGLQRFLQ